MAQRAIIQLTGITPVTQSNCTSHYTIRYKVSGDAGWNTIPVANPNEDGQIIIENLLDETTYDIEVTRNCCNGGVSQTVVDEFTTGETSPLG